jgi:hypothetical protein
MVCERLQAAGQQPDRDANERQGRLRAPPVEHAGAAPGQREGAEQHAVGEIDRQRIRHGAVEAEQHDRVARIRWALPHQASARLLKFCAHAKNNSRPSMISTCIVTMKSVLTSRSMAIDESAVVTMSGMAASYRLPTRQG